jgi:hypothetical protein
MKLVTHSKLPQAIRRCRETVESEVKRLGRRKTAMLFWNRLHTFQCGLDYEGRGGALGMSHQYKDTEFIIRYRILRNNKTIHVLVCSHASGRLT